jgi:methionyl-tRNA formyltransferase
MKYLFIGSVEYSAYCLNALLEMGIDIVEIMCPYREASAFNSDYCDLSEVAKRFGRDVRYFKKIKDEVAFIAEKKPDVIFVLGLSQIISKDILEIPVYGCIGSHPALLPQNRGRHPLIWAMANGLRKSGITLFWLDESVDSGDIWGQREFSIETNDDAASVYEKIKKLSVEMLKTNIPELERGIIKRIPQDHTQATYWRKRSSKDGEIDWRMSSRRIYDLVRALVRPYVGAHCVYRGKETKIWKVKVIEDDNRFQNLEPGKIISADGGNIRVKTGDGIIELIEHEIDLQSGEDYL